MMRTIRERLEASGSILLDTPDGADNSMTDPTWNYNRRKYRIFKIIY
jgi:hypothetical protein